VNEKLDLDALEQECDPAVALTMSEAYYQRRILELIARIRELEGASKPGGGWHSTEDVEPPTNIPLLVAVEFDCPGDWRIKVGAFQQGYWRIHGASWTPTHWMPLPAAPSAGNDGAEGV